MDTSDTRKVRQAGRLPEDGFHVEIIGDLANMIKLPGGSLTNENICSVKVVAGVGFEPTTFRL